MMDKTAIRKAIRRVFSRKGLPERIDNALDAVLEPFWVPISGGGRVCNVPDGFFTELALEMLDQEGFSLETQKAVAALLRKEV
jgi:hypothetical protein